MSAELSYQEKLKTLTCHACGVAFAMPVGLFSHLLEQKQAGTFYCPNGHAACFTGKTDAEKAREELARERQRREMAEREVAMERKLREKAERSQKRTAKRVQNGVCPCCNRTFQNLARHMATKHPEQT